MEKCGGGRVPVGIVWMAGRGGWWRWQLEVEPFPWAEEMVKDVLERNALVKVSMGGHCWYGRGGRIPPVGLLEPNGGMVQRLDVGWYELEVCRDVSWSK